ncbi:glycoside hydrolase family 99-like domain-containing protein [uncultured Chryseobacterium sp.]|uniref:glycosyltransferase WbsX family protein n=1 Tax=uncultured Chryseobacterium sp. TaxID=259322 RepID=UPI0025FBF857|nr:glycoside hydrolase family 99-like domain-containing protein [uncultured Chryseobacterium sp.]
MKKIKPLAFYLPQYHPIPENDEWWGKGFTEWTNVGKAKSLFDGHEQPICPGELGYYDLRVPEVREHQAQMARDYGVYGFIYYHYWFGNGKQLLERIANEVLASGKPDFPFCFCWANETWSGRWHGLEKKILAEQIYPSQEDLEAHFNYLLPFFKDKRYIKVNGKPVFVIYDPLDLNENAPDYISKLRALAKENGFDDLYIIASNKQSDHFDYNQMGYDGKISHAFQKAWIPYIQNSKVYISGREYYTKKVKKIFGIREKPNPEKKVSIQDISIIVDEMKFVNAGVETYPMILSNWDNTPRSGYNGVILSNNSPEVFRKQIDKAALFLKEENNAANFLILKSWNEWAEGNILEPDLKNGFSFLEEIKNMKNI